MRKLAWTILLASGAMLAAAPVSAQTYDPNYPVCMQVIVLGGGAWIDCSYMSRAQCEATATGRAAQSSPNPYFAHARQEYPGRAYQRRPRAY